MASFRVLLSVDPRTAPLLTESGCKDRVDSRSILDALGSATQVLALARGRHGAEVVAVMVADERVLVVTTGFLSELRNAQGQSSPLRLDAPVDSVGFAVERSRFDRRGHGTAVLETSTARLAIQDVRDGALVRLSRALIGAVGSVADPSSPTQPGFTPPQPEAVGDGPTDPGRPTGPAAQGWREAELLAVWHLRSLGYHDARITGSGADSGVDVIATGAVAQVKHWMQPVGQPPLRDLFGVAQAAAATGFFYSLSGYTPQALEWATATGIALFTYTVDGSAQACNTAAHDVERSSPGATRLGIFAQGRAERYRREQAHLRQQIHRLTLLMHKRTQSRRAAARQAAGTAAQLLTTASRALDGGDILPPADRRREDTYKAVRDILSQAKRLL